MIFFIISFILLYAFLAIISRKHFSKYKDKQQKGGFVAVLFMAMGRVIYQLVYKYISMNRIKGRLRKTQVVSKDSLDSLAEDYIVSNAAIGLFVMLVCLLASLMTCILSDRKADDPSNIIEREDYSGDVKKRDIYLTVDGQTSVYALEVQPTEYTEQEFLVKAQEIQVWLSTEMLGGNVSADCIKENLYLPERDETGCFYIHWQSQNPDIITSYGKVEWDLLTEDVVVVMVANISYQEYSVEFEFPLQVCVRSGADTKQLYETQMVLKDIEAGDRTKSFFSIPDRNGDVSISLGSHKEPSAYKWIVMGVMLCVVTVLRKRYQLDKSIKSRDKELNVMYSSFVSRICMLLGTGLTLRGCMNQIAYELRGSSTLKQELLYMMHELKMGRDETTTYTAFASRIGLPIYARLMNHINQNLRVGTKNLIHVLEEEVGVSLEMRNEYMKKRGEEVSTKLLFPMVVLLLIVMLIVMFPAMQNF